METALQHLMEAHSEQRRVDVALRWKAQGKKVIGYLCSYVPEEVITAAGMLPWRILGSAQVDTGRAAIHHAENACLFCHRALATLLEGRLDFLDGIVINDTCDEMQRLWDIWRHVDPDRFSFMMHLPRADDELSYRRYQKSIRDLIGALPAVSGAAPSEDQLRAAIAVYNEMRGLLRRLYELRKRELPAVSGAEAIAITIAATTMPKDELNSALAPLLDYLEARENPAHRGKPRLLVASSMLPDPAFLSLVEDAGAVVVMDDICTGSKYFWDAVDTTLEPTYALAKRYISRPPCPRMFFFPDKGLAQVARWVEDFHVDGVLHMPQHFCGPWQYTAPVYEGYLRAIEIPVASVSRGYDLTSAGQLRTRVEAFVEQLTS